MILPVTLGHGDVLDALVFGLVGLHCAALAYYIVSLIADFRKNGLNLPKGKIELRKVD